MLSRIFEGVGSAAAAVRFRSGLDLRAQTEERYHPDMSQPDFQPTLTGPTVIVRPAVAGDWAELFAAGSDPEIWKVHPSPDRYTEPAFRKFFDGAVASKM